MQPGSALSKCSRAVLNSSPISPKRSSQVRKVYFSLVVCVLVRLAQRWLSWLQDEGVAKALGKANAARIAQDGDRQVQMDAMDAHYWQLLTSSSST